MSEDIRGLRIKLENLKTLSNNYTQNNKNLQDKRVLLSRNLENLDNFKRIDYIKELKNERKKIMDNIEKIELKLSRILFLMISKQFQQESVEAKRRKTKENYNEELQKGQEFLKNIQNDHNNLIKSMNEGLLDNLSYLDRLILLKKQLNSLLAKLSMEASLLTKKKMYDEEMNKSVSSLVNIQGNTDRLQRSFISPGQVYGNYSHTKSIIPFEFEDSKATVNLSKKHTENKSLASQNINMHIFLFSFIVFSIVLSLRV